MVQMDHQKIKGLILFVLKGGGGAKTTCAIKNAARESKI